MLQNATTSLLHFYGKNVAAISRKIAQLFFCPGPNGSKKLVVQEIDLMSGKTDEAEFVTGHQSAASPKFRPPADGGVLTTTPSITAQSPEPPQANVQSPAIPPLLTLDPVQQKAAYQMTHYLNGLMCMVSEHFTSLER